MPRIEKVYLDDAREILSTLLPTSRRRGKLSKLAEELRSIKREYGWYRIEKRGRSITLKTETPENVIVSTSRKHYNLGRYRINIAVASYKYNFSSYVGLNRTHPHSSLHDNILCLGSGSRTFSRATRELRFYDALTIITSILSSYQYDQAYRSIRSIVSRQGKLYSCSLCGSRDHTRTQTNKCRCCKNVFCRSCTTEYLQNNCIKCSRSACKECLHEISFKYYSNIKTRSDVCQTCINRLISTNRIVQVR